jgi:hypothetical protein
MIASRAVPSDVATTLGCSNWVLPRDCNILRIVGGVLDDITLRDKSQMFGSDESYHGLTTRPGIIIIIIIILRHAPLYCTTASYSRTFVQDAHMKIIGPCHGSGTSSPASHRWGPLYVPCGIGGGQSGTAAGFSTNSLVFYCQCHFTLLHIHISFIYHWH